MTIAGATIKHPKRRGEWAEICFMKRAAELGLEVSKPWGDMASYDFIVAKGQHTARIQVKSTTHRHEKAYACTIRSCGNACYKSGSFDFIAVYLVLEDIWYIIPARLIVGKTSVEFFPNRPRSKYESFREAWHLLLPEPGEIIPSIKACIEREIRSPLPIRHPARRPLEI